MLVRGIRLWVCAYARFSCDYSGTSMISYTLVSPVALGAVPPASLLAHVASLPLSGTLAVTAATPVSVAAVSSVTAPPMASTALSWCTTPGGAENGSSQSLVAQLSALLQAGMAQQSSSDRVAIGAGFPTIPRKLLEKMLRWEFIELAELLPQASAHDAATPEADPQRFVLFPGCELIKPKKRQITTINDWVRAFAVYIAAMATKFPEAVPDMLAYQLAIIRASEQYDGLYWRAYDTHFRVNAAATGNRKWSRLDTDLYTRFFTGRAKVLAPCSSCDSTPHEEARCPVKLQRPKLGKRPAAGGAGAGPKKRKWPGDVCYAYNASGDCSYKSACRFRHACGVCGGKHPAKSCDKE